MHADNNMAKIEQLLQDEKGVVVATSVPSWLKLPAVHAAADVRRDLPFYLLESSGSGGDGGGGGAVAGAGSGSAGAGAAAAGAAAGSGGCCCW